MIEDGKTDGRADGQTEELPEALVAMAREINAPTPTPREEIWARVQAARTDRRTDGPTDSKVIPITVRRSDRQAVRRFTIWASGIAAILIVGVALGRNSVSNAPAGGASTRSHAPDSALPHERKTQAYTIAAVQHLSRVETFLTTLRTAPGSQFAGQARDLLTSTRLLLDAPDLDPRVQRLLADLEDILVQLVQYEVNGKREDLDLITDGLEERQVLPRLHSAIPAGPARAL